MEDILYGQHGVLVQQSVEQELIREQEHARTQLLLLEECLAREKRRRPENAKSKSAQVKLVYLVPIIFYMSPSEDLLLATVSIKVCKTKFETFVIFTPHFHFE